MPDLKLEILPKAQRLLWKELNQLPKSFVLYGGTALALRLGHRHSVDFDFFSNDHFKPDELLSSLGSLRDARVDQRGDNTLSITVTKLPGHDFFFRRRENGLCAAAGSCT